MNVYIFQAALLCDPCGELQESHILAGRSENERYQLRSEAGSDEFPVGPYADGGGEADCPQHCDHCGVFLANPLTDAGVAYVREALAAGRGDAAVLSEWTVYYGLDEPD